MNLKNSYLFKPQGSISRWIDSIMLILSGLSCFLIYYFIEYDVCTKGECSKLFITEFWVETTFIYLVLGVSLLIVGVFIAKEKDLIRIYSLGILVACLGAASFHSLIFFAILREFKTVT
jgi:hypothetical protein